MTAQIISLLIPPNLYQRLRNIHHHFVAIFKQKNLLFLQLMKDIKKKFAIQISKVTKHTNVFVGMKVE